MPPVREIMRGQCSRERCPLSELDKEGRIATSRVLLVNSRLRCSTTRLPQCESHSSDTPTAATAIDGNGMLDMAPPEIYSQPRLSSCRARKDWTTETYWVLSACSWDMPVAGAFLAWEVPRVHLALS